MLDLALHSDSGPISLAEIADRQDISLSYLEQLFARLRKRQLVSSIRGPGGGYMLGKEARDIDIAGVITAVDERIDTTACGGQGNCHGDKRCITHELWQDLSNSIYDYLSHISLQDLMDRQHRRIQEVSAVGLDEHRPQPSADA
jgi:Rrf2 family iron-sulfur cluster assembly transcriptional regulator